MNRNNKKNFYLFLFSILFALFICEIYMRLVFGFSTPFSGLSRLLGENFYFYTLNKKQELPKFESFDAYLGWKAGIPSSTGRDGTINADGWRSKVPYLEEKNKIRVAILGDSFTAGLNLHDNETVDYHLSKMLGDHYEVYNFAASGYGVDQMVTVATRILPRYKPDYVILAFIGDDLYRSCISFLSGALKPSYTETASGLELQNIPILTPSENLVFHQKPWNRFKDAFFSYVLSIRVLSMITEPVFKLTFEDCAISYNLKLFDLLEKKLGDNANIIYAHLFRNIPAKFEKGMKERKYPFLPLPEQQDSIAAKLGLKFGTVDGYHPDKNGTKVHASAYADVIKSLPLISHGLVHK